MIPKTALDLARHRGMNGVDVSGGYDEWRVGLDSEQSWNYPPEWYADRLTEAGRTNSAYFLGRLYALLTRRP